MKEVAPKIKFWQALRDYKWCGGSNCDPTGNFNHPVGVKKIKNKS